MIQFLLIKSAFEFSRDSYLQLIDLTRHLLSLLSFFYDSFVVLMPHTSIESKYPESFSFTFYFC